MACLQQSTTLCPANHLNYLRAGHSKDSSLAFFPRDGILSGHTLRFHSSVLDLSLYLKLASFCHSICFHSRLSLPVHLYLRLAASLRPSLFKEHTIIQQSMMSLCTGKTISLFDQGESHLRAEASPKEWHPKGFQAQKTQSWDLKSIG